MFHPVCSNATDLTDIITSSVAAVALIVGAGIALWKFVLQQPFGPRFRIEVGDCQVRRSGDGVESPRWAYTVNLTVTNESQAKQRMNGFWRRARLSVDGGDDPNRKPTRRSDAEAEIYYGECTQSDYWLAPGQTYTDAIVITHQQLCEILYVEYRLTYSRLTFRAKVVPRSVPRTRAQILVAPISRDDLTAISDLSHGDGSRDDSGKMDRARVASLAGDSVGIQDDYAEKTEAVDAAR